VLVRFTSGYYWSLTQVDYATYLVWERREDLAPVYDALVRDAVHAVQAAEVASFLGCKAHPLYGGEVGTDFHTRIECCRIKHHMGKASVKMYDKLGRDLCIETTVNGVSFFQHHSRVEHKDETWTMTLTPVKKWNYSLPALCEHLHAANRRYLVEFLSSLDDPTAGMREPDRIGRRVHDGRPTHRGFNIFAGDDLKLFETLLRGEYTLRGFQNRHLQELLGKTSGHFSRLLKRLRTHGLIKKARGTYRYHLTQLGRRLFALALKLRRFYFVP